MKQIRCVVACALALIAGPAAAEDLRNWFGDPYFQVRSAAEWWGYLKSRFAFD